MIGAHLPLKPPHFALARQVIDVLGTHFDLFGRARCVVGIGGESGSGKSVTAACMALELEKRGLRVALIHQDDYFHLPPRTNHAARIADLSHVGPPEVDVSRLAHDVQSFRDAACVTDAPLVDYAANTISNQTLDFSGTDVLLVEGTYVLGLNRLAQTNALDLRVFLAHTFDETRAQRHARLRDATDLDPIIEEILSIEHAYVRDLSASPDVRIRRDYTLDVPGQTAV